jgi:streptomycin 6-kinase
VIDIPSQFVELTVAREGESGRRWIESLPDLVASCLDRWALVPEGPVWHGYVGVALPVSRADGQAAVLKISWLNDDSRGEVYALAAWAGNGAVMLLDHDEPAGAMLLERLDQTHSVRDLDGESAARVVGQVCRQLAVSVPPPGAASPCPLPLVADLASSWVTDIPANWTRLGKPLPSAVVDAAVATCRELGPDQPDLLLHGDLVFDNILHGDRAPWLAIDPYGLVGEPAYDAAKLLSNRWSELAAQPDLRTAVLRRLAAFAEGAQVDVVRSRRWAQARLVNDALWCREHQPDVAPYVDTLATLLV